jgi:hypothetical protein
MCSPCPRTCVHLVSGLYTFPTCELLKLVATLIQQKFAGQEGGLAPALEASPQKFFSAMIVFSARFRLN